MSQASQRTQFKISNGAWKARSTHGRKPIFDNAEAMNSACVQCFQWCEDNPLMSVKLVKYQGEATPLEVPVMRPYTLTGLCCHIGITIHTWAVFKRKPDFSYITERIENIIYVQIFDRAVVGIFNANIITRELGLGNKQCRSN